jgi:hypothetical protein
MIRPFHYDDLAELQRIHAKFYKDEFELPDFVKHYLCAFSVTDTSGDIICTGGVRTIVESIAVTNKDFSVRDRYLALTDLFGGLQYVTKRFGYDEIHSFIQDEKWLNQLKKYGFRDTKGRALVLSL